MSPSQTQSRNHQDSQHTSLLRPRNESEDRELAAAGADMVAALHPQRLMGNAALAGLGQSGDPAVGGRNSLSTISGRTVPVVQTKLMLGPADDAFEREADSVADQVVHRMATQESGSVGGAPAVQREGMEEEEVQAKHLQSAALQPIPVVQRMEEEEEEIQAKRTDGAAPSAMIPFPVVQREEEEEEELQLARNGDASAEGGTLLPEVESQIAGARSGGSGLPDNVRGGMEQSFGADFSGVRVHTGAKADTLNRQLNAKAFTTGRDIFFREGE
ncbi:MAG: DUF4157 domain-containing protein, partial [Caldilineaceae bacterium]